MFKTLRSFFIGEKLKNLKDHHGRVKALTNFYFSIILFFGFSIALVPAFISDRSDILILPVFSGFIFSVILLFANKLISSPKVMGLFFVVFGLTVAFSNLFFNTEVLHIGAPLWILVVIFYSFYNIGITGSLIVSIFSFSTYVFWIVYFLDDEVQRVQPKIQETVPLLVLEISIAFVLLVSMAIVYMKAILSEERQLMLKNKQMKLQQKKADEESRSYTKQVRKSTDNIHKYFDTIHGLIRENGALPFLTDQFMFSAVVFKVFSLQGKHKENDPGVLFTSTLSKATATFTDKKINYTVDNTIDYIEEQHVFPITMVLTMLIYSSCKSTDVQNISVSYFYQNGEVVLRYQDDREHEDSDIQTEQTRISNIILSDVGASYISREDRRRSFVELRFPL